MSRARLVLLAEEGLALEFVDEGAGGRPVTIAYMSLDEEEAREFRDALDSWLAGRPGSARQASQEPAGAPAGNPGGVQAPPLPVNVRQLGPLDDMFDSGHRCRDCRKVVCTDSACPADSHICEPCAERRRSGGLPS